MASTSRSKLTRLIILLTILLLPASGLPVSAERVSTRPYSTTHSPNSGTLAAGTRSVNAPYFDSDVSWAESAIFWFGKNEQGSAPTRNYTDVRVGYTPDALEIRLTIADYYLWYNDTANPSSDLAPYDAAAIYLDTSGDSTATPQADDYWFFIGAHMDWQTHSNYTRQAQGTGSGWNANWTPPASPYWGDESWATMSWNCNPGPNSNSCGIDYGWMVIFTIPWQTLGLSGRPADGATWGMGVQVYDQDQNTGSPLDPETWPETFTSAIPSTWGELIFNAPDYEPPAAVEKSSTTVRQGLNGTVQDAWMGGGGTCGGGHNGGAETNNGYSGDLFTGSETAVTHLPCFNKTYLRFSLDDIPANRIIMSAAITLHLWGHAGETPELAQPSWVHLFTISDSWEEMEINWNNAPLAQKNTSVIQVNPYSGDRANPTWPGDPYTWDATQAVAEAYAAGQPLSVALYASDSAQHSSKYYVGSESTIENGRPTLTITWGRAAAELTKAVAPAFGNLNDSVTYTLNFLGTGNTLTLTTTLPSGVNAPGSFELTGTSITPTYESGQHRLIWSDNPTLGQEVTIRYGVTINTSQRQVLISTSELSEAGSEPNIASVTVIANPAQTYLPLILEEKLP